MKDTFIDASKDSSDYRFGIFNSQKPPVPNMLVKRYLNIPNEISIQKIYGILEIFIKGSYFGVLEFNPSKNPEAIAQLIKDHASKQKSSYFAIKFNGMWQGITIEPLVKTITYVNVGVTQSSAIEKFYQSLNNKHGVVPDDFNVYGKTKEIPITEPGQSAVYTLLDLVGRYNRRNGKSTKGLKEALMKEVAEDKEIIWVGIENIPSLQN